MKAGKLKPEGKFSSLCGTEIAALSSRFDLGDGRTTYVLAISKADFQSPITRGSSASILHSLASGRIGSTYDALAVSDQRSSTTV